MTAPASSSSAADPGELLRVDLAEAGLLAPLPAAFLAGRDTDLLAPLGFLAPGERPAGEPPRPDRTALARATTVANRAYGHPRAEELGRRLADPATRVVVAGQQPGLFGGPLYTLSKMIAASRWAEAIEEGGQPAVAVFWVATEDHDWAEVASTTVLTPQGPEQLDLGADPEPLVPVGMRTLGPGLEEVFRRLGETMPGERYEDWLALLRRWYRPDARFGEAFCRLMVELLGERCPLLLDAMLPELKLAEKPWLMRLVERRHEVEAALAAADREIGERGYPLQVSPQRGVSPLFLFHGGERRRVEWQGEDGFCLRGREDTCGSVEELLEWIDDNPTVASPGVLARPALQDAALGTALQVLGPGELSYMPQAAPVYRALGIDAPQVTLRPQALVLESHQREKLSEVGLPLAALIGDRKRLDHLLAEASDGDPVRPVRERVDELLAELGAPLVAVDPNLERPWEKTRQTIDRSLEHLSDKVAAAAARANEVQARRVDQLRDACLPLGRLQERVLSSSHFPGKYRGRFAESFWEQLGLDPRTLQVVEP